ncbi:MAG: hypothetical protein R6X19_11315 [Kiritimatiellia bacterium]
MRVFRSLSPRNASGYGSLFLIYIVSSRAYLAVAPDSRVRTGWRFGKYPS